MTDFLPMTREDMAKRGWQQLDFLFISGDAYVDHPSFGPAIISRLLEKYGYKVGLIAQPDWRSTTDFKKLGKPRLGVLVSAGNLDSMLNKYTAAKKYRSTDNYSPGGQAGCRPERATIVYCNRIRELWKNTPLVIGGIEASLRRFAHYDYWSDSVRRSILIDSRADLLIYGMGEKQIKELAAQLSAGISVDNIRDIPGTCYRTESLEHLWQYTETPGFEQVTNNKKDFAEAFKTQYLEQDPIRGKIIVQNHGEQYVVQNPPSMPLSTPEMDEIYDLPYQRTYHPSYIPAGGIPAIQEVKFSIVSHRGCYGSCSFCALYAHQGRIIQSRSQESILQEAEQITKLPDFKGYIHDVGGPTANFRQPACDHQADRGTCRGKQCLFPAACKSLNTSHNEYLELLRAIRKLPGIKKVFVRSGLRYDYLLAANDMAFLKELCEHHVSGQLKVAPEHISPKVTKLMGKAGRETYLKFKKAYEQANKELGKEQYLVPYYMSSHPGAGLKEAVELAEFLRDTGYNPEQVQDFIPTPGSLSTCMYYTGLHPLTGEKVYVAKTAHDKRLQRALLQYRNPKNHALVYEALTAAGRQDLIGYEPKCLIRPLKQGHYPAGVKPGGKPDKHRSLQVTRNKKTKKQTSRS
ncbi:YgiQ family radical SAM protein [Sporomusa termitida]|uniref:Putative radical SAM protein YgiQ n=1 Tax=Sporomusa termitida TaxID=2377 RepID=A0A517DTE3_9FIRM|nr:YgiQ family radical SAM protein [Sporomusa termitida]QDR80578.1 putative radical SAM protein YgiQ [Sporomusa termitida]